MILLMKVQVEENLFGNYKFDDINLNTIYDCSINKHHGIWNGQFGANNHPNYSNDIPPLTDKACDPQLVEVVDESQIVLTFIE